MFDQQAHSEEIKADFEKYEGEPVSIAGRMLSKGLWARPALRISGTVRGKFRYMCAGTFWAREAYAAFKQMDIGDILGVSGTVFKTNAGEVSVKAERIVLFVKISSGAA